MRPIALVLLLLAACADRTEHASLGGRPGLDIADIALANGAPQTALNVARQTLAGDPRNVPALLREAEAEVAMGQRTEAIGSFQRALAASPDNTDAALGLGRLQLATDPQSAAGLFSRAVGRDPRNVAALIDLGIASDLLGRHAAAQAAYRRALAIEPTRAAAGINLGLSLALAGDAPQAVAILRPLAMAPDAAPRVRQNLAAALVLSGDADGAAAVLRADMPADRVVATIAGYQSLASRP